MKIYEVLLIRAYEGVSQTFCTVNEVEASNWLNTHYDDYATLITWHKGEKVKIKHYVLKKDRWILKSYK